MIRKATVSRLKPEKREQYITMHKNAWPEVSRIMAQHHHEHHSVYVYGDYLFQYLEYTGEDFEADMAQMRQSETMQKWWTLCRECVMPFDGGDGPAWETLEEIFHNNEPSMAENGEAERG